MKSLQELREVFDAYPDTDSGILAVYRIGSQIGELEVVNHIIDMLSSEISWTENNFIPGPHGQKYIEDHQTAINLLTEYRDDILL